MIHKLRTFAFTMIAVAEIRRILLHGIRLVKVHKHCSRLYASERLGEFSSGNMEVHETAQKGYQQGAFYDEKRPSYTDESVEAIVDMVRKIGVKREFIERIKYDIVELGAGTGKFTRKLLEKIESERFLTTEPSEEFLEVLKKQSPCVEALQCAANYLPLEDQSVKSFVGAECFHWFANLPSLTEINRVLIPGGLLVLIWNRKDQGVQWVDRLLKSVECYMGENPPPQYFDMRWKAVFQHVPSIQHLEDIKLDGIQFEGSADFLLDNLFSKSYMSKLPEDEKQKARKKLLEQIQETHGNSRTINVPHYTIIHVYKKIH